MTRSQTIAAILAAKAKLPPIKDNMPCTKAMLAELTDATLADVLKFARQDLASPTNHVSRPPMTTMCMDCRHYPRSRRKGVWVCQTGGIKVMATEHRACFEKRPNTTRKATGKAAQ
jgi:hypothetical protein